MRRNKLKLSAWLLAFLLAALVSFSVMMCLTEGFTLRASPTKLMVVCIASSLLAACAMLPERRRLWTLGTLALWLAAAVWQRHALMQQALALLYAVTTEYAAVYGGIAVIGQAGDCLLLLAFLAVPYSWLTAWTICREGNALLLVLACLPVLLLCLMIVELAPMLWLVVLTFALLLLLMTNGVREHSVANGSRLAWWLLLPSVIFVMAITIIWPPADHQRSQWAESLRAAAEEGLSLDAVKQSVTAAVEPVTQWGRARQRVDLSSLGPKTMTGQRVLESQSVQQRYYLRGLSLGVYENNRWEAVEAAEYAAGGFTEQPLLSVSNSSLSLYVRTDRTEDLLYTTYTLCGVPESAEFVDDAYVENAGGLREYRIDHATAGVGNIPPGYDDYVNEVYTQLPDQLRAELEAFLLEMGWDQPASPEKLAGYVKNSAVYDLDTPRLPRGEEFILYFLRESHRGYCVHFATATAALLRTMGVPARYVTGYLVSGEPGTWVTVTGDDAHAWVEYYVSGVGWVPLEATPAAQETEIQPDVPQAPEAPDPVPEQPTPTEPETPEQETPPEGETPLSQAPGVQEPTAEAAHPTLWLLLVPAAAALVLIRYGAVRQGRADRCRRGHPNRRALAYWHWLVQLARQEGTAVEEPLICLAEKARFSQHTLTEEELEQLHQAVETRIARLKQYPVGKQLWFRFGKVLY